MNKKILVSLSIILFTIFSFTICQATDDVMKSATNNIRNFVGGVENTVENAARTSTDTTTVTGMSQTAWTWLILGVAAIAIIAVVWYYSMQFTNTGCKGNNNNNDDEYFIFPIFFFISLISYHLNLVATCFSYHFYL